ncbi:MAG: hypothetical protein WC712_12620 [Candidatus Brocadiia bacterium]
MAEQNTFACPHCGKMIYVIPVQPLQSPQPAQSAQPEQPTRAITPPPPPVHQRAITPDDIPTRAVDITEIPLKDVILEPEPIEEAEPVEAEPVESVEPEPIEDFEEIEELKPEDLEEYVPNRPTRPATSGRPDASGARPVKKGPPASGPRPARPMPAKKAGGTGEYALFLEPVERRDEKAAAEIIMDVAGVNDREANSMLRRSPIIVLKNVSREEAEDALAAFEDQGLAGSVKRKAPRR